jgi:hypothetical protein
LPCLLSHTTGCCPTQALVQLQGPHSTDACRRRTLRLLASKIGGVQQEAEDLVRPLPPDVATCPCPTQLLHVLISEHVGDERMHELIALD